MIISRQRFFALSSVSLFPFMPYRLEYNLERPVQERENTEQCLWAQPGEYTVRRWPRQDSERVRMLPTLSVLCFLIKLCSFQPFFYEKIIFSCKLYVATFYPFCNIALGEYCFIIVVVKSSVSFQCLQIFFMLSVFPIPLLLAKKV